MLLDINLVYLIVAVCSTKPVFLLHLHHKAFGILFFCLKFSKSSTSQIGAVTFQLFLKWYGIDFAMIDREHNWVFYASSKYVYCTGSSVKNSKKRCTSKHSFPINQHNYRLFRTDQHRIKFKRYSNSNLKKKTSLKNPKIW